jgi:membrane associated rhomboid family serine protease
VYPVVTQTLIIANIAFLFIQTNVSPEVWAPFALWPLGPRFEPWQLVTYAFLHGNMAHIFFNMLGLFMFGSDVERLWGARRYAAYYFICVLSAAAAQLATAAVMGVQAPTIGASGGVFGLLLAFALSFPNRVVVLLFPPIPMPAWLFAALYGVLEVVLGLTGTSKGVAHFAHLGGMVGGFLLIMSWRRRHRRF